MQPPSDAIQVPRPLSADGTEQMIALRPVNDTGKESQQTTLAYRINDECRAHQRHAQPVFCRSNRQMRGIELLTPGRPRIWQAGGGEPTLPAFLVSDDCWLAAGFYAHAGQECWAAEAADVDRIADRDAKVLELASLRM